MVSSTLFMTLHAVLLAGFLCVTLALLVVTLMNRRRVRGVVLSWRTGRLFGFPLWPSLFLGLVMALLGYALIASPALSSLLAGYVVGGALWLTASLMMRSVIVTEQGLLLNVNRTSERVSWQAVVDYFERTETPGRHYVFFYRAPDATRQRLEVRVPASCAEAFQCIVSTQLDDRFNGAARQLYGKKALEG